MAARPGYPAPGPPPQGYPGPPTRPYGPPPTGYPGYNGPPMAGGAGPPGPRPMAPGPPGPQMVSLPQRQGGFSHYLNLQHNIKISITMTMTN